jgi:hypothetical protein
MPRESKWTCDRHSFLWCIKYFGFLSGVVFLVRNQIFGTTCLSHLQGFEVNKESFLDHLETLKMGQTSCPKRWFLVSLETLKMGQTRCPETLVPGSPRDPEDGTDTLSRNVGSWFTSRPWRWNRQVVPKRWFQTKKTTSGKNPKDFTQRYDGLQSHMHFSLDSLRLWLLFHSVLTFQAVSSNRSRSRSCSLTPHVPPKHYTPSSSCKVWTTVD